MLQERDLPEHYRVWRREDGLRELVPGPLYKATDLRTNSIVVLRFFEGAAVESLTRRTALLLEATSPWIAALRDAFAQDDTLVTSTDFIVGETLAERVARRGPLPVATVWEAAVQGVEALAALHARGVRHGHLGPSSLLFPDNPGDSGLVKLVGCGLPRSGKAAADAALAEEEAAALPDDLRRLGVSLWFALTGHFPFGGDPAALADGSPKADALLAAFAILLCGEPDRQPNAARALLEALKVPPSSEASARPAAAETLPVGLPLPGLPLPPPAAKGEEPAPERRSAADLAIPLPPDKFEEPERVLDAGASPLVIPPPSVILPGQRDPRRDKPSPDSPPPPVPARKSAAPATESIAPKKKGFGWL